MDTYCVFYRFEPESFCIILCTHIADEGAKSSGDDDTNKILKQVHDMLHVLIKRIEGTEKKLKSMTVRLSTPSSDSSSAKETGSFGCKSK